MLEVGEYQGGFCDWADLLRASGDVLQDAPASDEESEAAFADSA